MEEKSPNKRPEYLSQKLDRALAWFERHSRWSRLRALGQSNLIKASVLMPAFGYILLLNDNVHQFLTIKYDGWLLHHLHLPSTWRIWLLFYGSFFLAAGSILFSVCCPPKVKQYADAFQAIDAERNHHATLGLKEELEARVRALDVMSTLEERIFSLPRLRFGEPSYGITSSSDALTPLLFYEWMMSDIKRPVLRMAILVLFWSGLLLLAIPAVLTFVQVH